MELFTRFKTPRALACFLSVSALSLPAEPSKEAKEAYLKGDYDLAASKAMEGIEENEWKEDLWVLRVRALMARGSYEVALKSVDQALEKVPRGIRIRLAAHEVFLFNDDANRSEAMLTQVNNLAATRGWAYRNAPDMVALGRIALKLGAGPKLVLDNLYSEARKKDADYPGIALAIGDLALSKSDFELAGRTFQLALKKGPKTADLHYGAARAFAPSDRAAMLGHLQAALSINPNHLSSHILLVNHLIDVEAFDEAERQLEKVLKVNPHHPEAWASKSILAHLREDKEAEDFARDKALAHWKNNPKVDHVIGRKLSQRYRFAEGAEHQRSSLAMDEDFLPARIQLAQDLLRLGKDEEGWKLAQEVHEADGYDVTTFNLVNLKDTLDKFETIRSKRFVLRMAKHEAAVYGSRAMRLLERAHATLTKKYGLKLEVPTLVEIYDKQKDFGVRTFGMPENPGFLGVCFGCVITANSPASQMPYPANWEAVLWHEFCHTVTLTLTKNKMPRWLSEGISVYEERQASRTWGEKMNPRYREMILGGELTPVSKLSGAFLSPKTPEHLQFAYFQSSLVVEHIVDRFGHPAIRSILEKLRQGVEVNKAIAETAEPMPKLEAAFAEYAVKLAKEHGSNLDWERRLSRPAGGTPDDNASAKPNFFDLARSARKLIGEEKWEEAKAPCRKLIELYPDFCEREGNAYLWLARAHRELEEYEDEKKTLEALAALSGDNYDAFVRLVELASEAGERKSVKRYAERALAVNPLLPGPHRQLALVAEHEKDTDAAIEAWQTLLKLSPEDLPEAHFRLACLLRPKDKSQAKRYLLMALEDAPRFREAHRLLIDWNNGTED